MQWPRKSTLSLVVHRIFRLVSFSSAYTEPAAVVVLSRTTQIVVCRRTSCIYTSLGTLHGTAGGGRDGFASTTRCIRQKRYDTQIVYTRAFNIIYSYDLSPVLDYDLKLSMLRNKKSKKTKQKQKSYYYLNTRIVQ